MFEPTITLFQRHKNSYKKVGTRFLRLLSVGNKKLQHTNNRQIDMVLKPTRTITSTQGDNFNNDRDSSKVPRYRWLNYPTDKFYLHKGGLEHELETFDSDLGSDTFGVE